MMTPDELQTFGERRSHVRRAAIASRGTHYSTFDRFADTVCTGLLIKTVYVVCATTLTMSLFVECIMVNLIIVPYRHESLFEEADCFLQYIEPEMPLIKCESKCSKDRSMFPCLRVHIVYEWGNRNHTAILFDSVGTHANYKKPRCVTSMCHRRVEDNRYAVDLFKMKLLAQRRFRCFASGQYQRREALIMKYYNPGILFHAVFWPVLVFTVSLVALLLTLFFHRYRAWKHRRVLLG